MSCSGPKSAPRPPTRSPQEIHDDLASQWCSVNRDLWNRRAAVSSQIEQLHELAKQIQQMKRDHPEIITPYDT